MSKWKTTNLHSKRPRISMQIREQVSDTIMMDVSIGTWDTAGVVKIELLADAMRKKMYEMG